MFTSLELTDTTPADLTRIAQVLPVIGGTVTEILEQYLGEPLQAIRLEHRTRSWGQPLLDLALSSGEPVLERRVLLQGARTRRAVLYAESIIALNRLPAAMKDGLLSTDQPIGLLLRTNRVETFRELIACERRVSPSVAAVFGLGPDVSLLVRTYRMCSANRDIMLITEWFPC